MNSPHSARFGFVLITILLAIGPKAVHAAKAPPICDRVEVMRRLLVAETSIEIAPDPRMLCTARELADMINVIGNRTQSHHSRQRLAALPTRVEHPPIKGGSDHRAARD